MAQWSGFGPWGWSRRMGLPSADSGRGVKSHLYPSLAPTAPSSASAHPPGAPSRPSSRRSDATAFEDSPFAECLLRPPEATYLSFPRTPDALPWVSQPGPAPGHRGGSVLGLVALGGQEGGRVAQPSPRGADTWWRSTLRVSAAGLRALAPPEAPCRARRAGFPDGMRVCISEAHGVRPGLAVTGLKGTGGGGARAGARSHAALSPLAPGTPSSPVLGLASAGSPAFRLGSGLSPLLPDSPVSLLRRSPTDTRGFPEGHV